MASKANGKRKAPDYANKASNLHVVCSPECGSRYESAWENPPHTTTPLMPHFDDGMELRYINTGSPAQTGRVSRAERSAGDSSVTDHSYALS